MPPPRLTWSAALLYGSLRLLGRLPLRVLHRLGVVLGRLLWLLPGKPRWNTQCNLSLITQDDAPTRRRQARAILIQTGMALTEVARVWAPDPQRALAMVREVRGGELLDDALAAGRGVIIAAPHLGCWEVLNYWLAARTPLAIAYRAPRRTALEPLLIRMRGALDVEQVRADGAGVRTLYRRLQAGGVVGILPDQQPRQGEGEFAPFFGVPALTMVLLPRLAQRTGATVLFAFAERLPDAAGFRVHLRPAPAGIADPHLPTACAALNRGVEDCVRSAFDQYQWTYKRYSIRPGADEANPYRRTSPR